MLLSLIIIKVIQWILLACEFTLIKVVFVMKKYAVEK